MLNRSLHPTSLLLTMLLIISLVPIHESLARSSQSYKPFAEYTNALSAASEGVDYVLQEVDGSVGCQDATSEESALFAARDELIPLETISPLRSTELSPEDVGLQIVLRGTPQLENFPQAKNAFLRAAQTWENLIQTPITIIIDVDFGPTRFGVPYPPLILGSTDTQDIGASSIYPDIRSHLISHASNARESDLYNGLPASSIRTDIGTTAGVTGPSALFRALGLIKPAADPASETASLGPPPSIGFNSSFAYDFDPSNGIDSNKTDFDAVAVHELGHALGFASNVGSLELDPSAALRPAILDLFRMRPGVTSATFPTATRIMSSGGSQVFFAGTSELALSTGRPDASGGDGRQASHWKDDTLSGVYLGIMDPVLDVGVRETITNNDLLAFDSFGYQIRNGGGNTITLTSGVAQPGSIPAPPSGASVVNTTQYSVQVPAGAPALKIDLNGNQDLDLYVRFNQRINIDSSGHVVADYTSESPTGVESVTVNPSSAPPLSAGTYYIAVGNFGPGAANFNVTATVARGSSGSGAPAITNLQADLDGDSLTLTGTAQDSDGDITQAQSELLDSEGHRVGQTAPFPVNFGGQTTVNFRLQISNLNALPAAMLASLVFIDSHGNRASAATADFSEADPGGPTLSGASYNGKKLSIKGSGFASQVLIEINGSVIGISPSTSDRKLKIKGNPTSLNLQPGPNRLRILNGESRSNLYVLTF